MSDQDMALQDALACVRVSPDDFDLGAEVAGVAADHRVAPDHGSGIRRLHELARVRSDRRLLLGLGQLHPGLRGSAGDQRVHRDH